VEAMADRPNHVLGRFQAIEGMTWNTIALYGPYLLVRNAEEAACYELPLESSGQ
jgi:outer membrane protein assembly factor BamB